MKPCYLRSASVFGFRVFPEGGAHFDFEAPGITVLVGQNGLGKSSLFEAIEWALTGRVERIERLSSEVVRKENVASYYAQRSEGKLANAVEVRLNFDVDKEQRTLNRRWERVSGSDRFKPVSQAFDDEVRSILCDATWGVPVDRVGAYLHDTHFLVQSTGNRWAALSPKERWERVEGPAGFGRLEHVRGCLGRSTELAFNRITAECQQRVDDANSRLAEWRDVLSLAQRRRASSSVSGVPWSVEQLRVRTETLVKDLLELVREFQRKSTPVHTVEVIDLGAANSLIREAERLFAEREEFLESAADIPGKARSVTAEINSLRAETIQRAEAIKRLGDGIAAVGSRLDASKAESVVAKKRSVEARAVVERLQKLRAYLEERPRIVLSVEELQSSAIRISKELSEASAAAAALTVAVERASEAQQKLREAAERTNSYRLLYARVSLWLKDAASIQVKRKELAECRLRQSTSALRIADAGRRVDIAFKTEKAAKGRLAKVQRQRDEIAQLVSNLIVKITRDHCKCPVCHTSFGPGELLRRVTDEAAAGDPLLGRAQEECSAAAKAVAEANLNVTELQEVDLRLADRIAELSRTISAHDAELELLRATEAIGGLSTESAEGLLEQLAGFRKASELNMEQWSREGDDVMILREELTQAETKRKGIEGELLRLRRVTDEGRSRLRTIDSELAAHRDRVELWRQDASRADVDVAESIQQTTQAEGSEQDNLRQLRGISKELDELKDRKSAAVRQSEAHEQLVREREQYLKVLQDGWTATGLPEGIEESNVERLRQRLNRAREELAGLKVHEQRLREDSAQVERSAEGEQDEVRIRGVLAEAKLASESERTVALELQLKRVEEEMVLAERAYTLYRKLADQLKKSAKQYAQNVIAPLQTRANRFHLALSPFPERELILGVRAALGAGTSLHLNVQPHRGRENSEELAAHLLLSEGQLSEASLSFLFGMSTSYRWSRWRALLLDDPLQQNDVVHVSSFVDVIRRLVLDYAYQIVVSTHDSDLADFMVRKARAGGVRCTVYRFVNPGRAEATYRAS